MRIVERATHFIPSRTSRFALREGFEDWSTVSVGIDGIADIAASTAFADYLRVLHAHWGQATHRTKNPDRPRAQLEGFERAASVQRRQENIHSFEDALQAPYIYGRRRNAGWPQSSP
jgi:hypothetical protein